MYINCLKLLAAKLALQTFAKKSPDPSEDGQSVRANLHQQDG